MPCLPGTSCTQSQSAPATMLCLLWGQPAPSEGRLKCGICCWLPATWTASLQTGLLSLAGLRAGSPQHMDTFMLHYLIHAEADVPAREKTTRVPAAKPESGTALQIRAS